MKPNRALILIECKSTVNAIKSLFHAMPDYLSHAEHLTLRPPSARSGSVLALTLLSLASSVTAGEATVRLLAARRSTQFAISILGVYPGTEDYAG